MNHTFQNIFIGLFAAVVTLGAFSAGVWGAVSISRVGLTAAVAHTPQIDLAEDALVAEAAVLYDMRTNRVLYQKNANKQLPLASLTKLMAAEVVLSLREPQTPVLIERENLRTEGDSGLRVGETLTVGELITLALVASSNDAMEAAAASLGTNSIEQMNTAAKRMGLTQTHFFNATGLDVTETTSGAYGSAFDVARLATIFYNHHPDFFELTTRPEVFVDQRGASITAAATTAQLQSIPGFVAAKTGFTDLAGGNLVAVFDLEPGLTVVAVALGSTREGRFADIKTLIEAARASI
jgi:D-alanyl-D-alanine carboxypeptidase